MVTKGVKNFILFLTCNAPLTDWRAAGEEKGLVEYNCLRMV